MTRFRVALRSILGIASIALLLTGCASSRGAASRSRGGCDDAVDPEFLRSGPVFLGCQVDQQARAVTRPQLAPPTGTMTPAPACSSAEVEFVVDADGNPRDDYIRIVRTSSADLANRLRDAVPMMRFTPAKKDGEPVPQVVRFRVASQAVVARADAGRPSPRRMPATC